MRKRMHKPENKRLDVAAMFKALGDPTRLHIFKFLRTCCSPVAVEESGAVRPIVGPTVGESVLPRHRRRADQLDNLPPLERASAGGSHLRGAAWQEHDL